MHVIISSLHERYPCPLQVEAFTEKDAALERAVMLAKVQGASESDDDIRTDLEEVGFYIPSRYAEWSVVVAEVDLDAFDFHVAKTKGKTSA